MVTKTKLTIEQKTKILRELFEELTNPDKGLGTRKCVMKDWYEIRPGLRDNEETIFYAFRERDNALCGFDRLPHGTDSAEHLHSLDTKPDFEIIPNTDRGGFAINHRSLEFFSSNLPNKITFINETTKCYKQLVEKINTAISD